MSAIEKVSSPGIGMTGTVTRPADTPTYTAKDVIGTAVTSTMIMVTDSTAIPEGCHFIIMGASLRVDLNAVPATMNGFNLHLYTVTPTAIADDGAFNLAAADRGNYLGYIAFSTPEDLGDTLYVQYENINMKRKFASGSITLYGVLQTVGALVAAASTVFTVKLHAVQA